MQYCYSLNLDAFLQNWLPNIVCGLGFGGLGYLLGRRQSEAHERTLANLLEDLAHRTGQEVIRDKRGRITGVLNRTIQVGAGHIKINDPPC